MHTKFVLPTIMDLDDLFSRTPNTIVFNELMLERSAHEVVDILCDISSDKSDSVATCVCENLNGNYFKGVRCPVCGTVCQSNLFGEIRNDSWLAIPNSIKGVLNPQVFRILEHWMGNTAGHQSILRQILNMQLPNDPINNTPFYSGMGFNWFYDNFDAVMTYFITSHPSDTGRKQARSIELFLKATGKSIWCHYLPILSKLIQPITRVNKDVRYADTDIKNLMKAIFTLRSVLLAERTMKFSLGHIDQHFFSVYIEFIGYTKNIQFYKLPKKPSILRKHVFGSRSHCSARTVAVPITDPHDSDDVYFPWKLGVTTFKYHIISVLVHKLGLTIFEAYNRITEAVNMYDYEIDVIMQELIADCPYKGLPILLNRNPSLRIASIQLLFVVLIKPGFKQNPLIPKVDESLIEISAHDENDLETSSSILDYFDGMNEEDIKIGHYVNMKVEDATIAVSPLIVKGPNLD